MGLVKGSLSAQYGWNVHLFGSSAKIAAFHSQLSAENEKWETQSGNVYFFILWECDNEEVMNEEHVALF